MGERKGRVPRRRLPPNRQEWSFGDLLYSHLFIQCTRPPGHPRHGKPWAPKEFAEACGVDVRSVRNWLRDQVPPSRNKETIERVLFGPDLSHAHAERVELRQKFSERQKLGEPKIKTVFDGVPPVLAHLFGAEKYLTQLSSLFDASQVDWHSKSIALCGMSGVGKTTLVAAFAHMARPRYRGVWWCDASSRTLLLNRLGVLARSLGYDAEPGETSEGIAAVALQLLAGSGRPWLLIYDNVTSPADISDLIPHASHLLITSLYPDWSGLAQSMSIRPWEDAEAVEFLRRQTGQEDLASAMALNRSLDGLPLALDQAAVYCRRFAMPLSRYVEQVDKLIHKLPPSPLFPRSVAATFELAIERAIKADEEAALLVAILGHCAPGIVPEEIYARVGEDEGEIHAAVGTLADVSLIRTLILDSGRSAIWIHPLVTHVARQWSIERKVEEHAVSLVRGFLYEAFPRLDEVTLDELALCRVLLPHLVCVLGDLDLDNCEIMEGAEIVASLLRRLGMFMLEAEMGFVDIGPMRARPEMVFELAYDLALADLGREHPETLVILDQCARLHLLRLEFSEAIPYQEKIADQLRRGGAADRLRDVLISLARSYGKAGNIDRAAETAAEAFSLPHWGTGVPQTSILRDLGEAYLLKGQAEQGRAVLQDAIDKSREVGDLATLMSALLLLGHEELDDGYIERARGRFAEALSLYDQHADHAGVLLLRGDDCLLDPDPVIRPARYDKTFAEDLWRLIDFLAYEP